jgi:23S rRNA (guanosine2251-2'-O)-methyltransferase
VSTPGADAPLFGRHPVLELLRADSRRVEEIAIAAQGRGPALQELLVLAKRRGVRVSFRTREQLTAIAGTPHHQGVVARVAGADYSELGDVLAIPTDRNEPAFFLALDQVQDPRNLGAILRTADGAGAHGVIVTKHHSVGLTPAAAKSATGALEWVKVARVPNLAQMLERLKRDGIWVMGGVVEGGASPWETDLTGPLCLVFGGEGGGLRPLVARTCDLLLTLPMKGRLASMNVSAVAAVLCYEVVRQRRGAKAEARDRSEARNPLT